MHLRQLLIQDCKLMHRLELPFVRADGSPRLWTVFVGENGTCKTTLLRAIALSAAGSAFANHLVSDPSAYVDRRGSRTVASIAASFGFSLQFHTQRTYAELEPRPAVPPELVTITSVGMTSVGHNAEYGPWESRSEALGAPRAAAAAAFGAAQWGVRATEAAARAKHELDPVRAQQWMEAAATAAFNALKAAATGANPVDDARSEDRPHWYAAGYGVGRMLSVPQPLTEGAVPKRDRLKSLFDPRHLPLGTGFSDQLAAMFGDDRARRFAALLREALVERMRTPRLSHIELRGKGGASNQRNLIESHRFGIRTGASELKLPAIWLSQGYQAVISLVADIIGNVWLEAGEEVALDDMEGIVLVDELDLHLHPTWQTEIVAGLKATFPNMQFIVTTHSPLVLAGCRTDEVWMLRQDDQTGDVTAQPGEVSPMLLTGSELNREFFGVDRASPMSEHLRRYLELASDPYRSDGDDAEAAKLLQELRRAELTVDYEPIARKTAS
jgi:hypothetical protein